MADNKNETKAVTKYDAAVLKARKQQVQDIITNGSMDAATAGIAEQANPQMLAEMLASGDMVIADQILTLKQGQMIRGVCLSTGTTQVESIDRPGEMATVPTWTIEHASGTRVSILGAAMLDRQLKGCIGHEVCIYRGPEVLSARKRKVTQYLVTRGKQVYTPDEAKYLVGAGETVVVDAQS